MFKEADLHEENDDGVVDDEDDEDSGDYDDYDTDSLIEAYTSELDKDENEMDEYVTFYHLMTQLETSDTAWYQRLISSLTDAQKSEFKEIAQTAVNCMAQKGKISRWCLKCDIPAVYACIHVFFFLCRIKEDWESRWI